jgi:YidC/Oxa1 family membrane protein insertase
MDTKRIILATALSLAIVVLWSYFMPKPQPAPTPPPATSSPAQTPATPGQPASPAAAEPATAAPAAPVVAGKTLTVRTPLFEAKLNAQGGLLEHFTLLRYRQTIEPGAPQIDLIPQTAAAKAPLGLIWNGQGTWSAGTWSVSGEGLNLAGGESGTLRFTCALPGLNLVRELTFSADSYLIKEKVLIHNAGSAQIQGKLAFTLVSPGLTSKDDRYNPTRVAYLAGGSRKEESDLDDLAKFVQDVPPVQWTAVMSNYFLLAIVPEMDGAVMYARFVDDVYRLAIEKGGLIVDPGSQIGLSVDYYLSPKEEAYLKDVPNNLTEAIYYGFFNIIAKPLVWGLNFFYKYVGNYGLAIMLLTFCIKVLFWPLSQKSYKSMDRMRKLQPMMAKLREKYKDDRQRMNQELMQLYKTYNVNPAGGCLPMLLQIPVFFGLYQALLESIELRHAPFIEYLPFTDYIWLADLSAKDPYYITPLIMGATMFLQQKLTPAPGDPTQAKIMLFMPVIFTFMFLNFPSGLVIYWLVNNVLSIAQQWWTLKKSQAAGTARA